MKSIEINHSGIGKCVIHGSYGLGIVNHYQCHPLVTPSAAMMAEDLAEKWLRNCFEASTFVFYVESAVNNNNKTEEVLVGLFDNNKKGGGLESSKKNHQLKNNQRK